MKTINILYPKGKIKALSFSYDDGVNFDKQLIKIFDAHSLKGSFNINSAMTKENKYYMTRDGLEKISNIQEAEIGEVYKNHEVAIHGYTHPFWSNMPKEQVLYQMQQDKICLEQMVGYPVRGMAYPFFSYSEDVRKVAEILGIRYARTASTKELFQLPQDPLLYDATCHHNNPNLMTLAKRFVAETFNTQALFCVYGHTYEFANDHNWAIIEEFCDFVANRNEIWYATLIDIFDYVYASHQLIYTSDFSIVKNPTATTIWLKIGEEVIAIASGETKKI